MALKQTVESLNDFPVSLCGIICLAIKGRPSQSYGGTALSSRKKVLRYQIIRRVAFICRP